MSTLLHVFVHEQRMSLETLLQQSAAQRASGGMQGLLPFCNTHASMVKPESGGSVFELYGVHEVPAPETGGGRGAGT